jgi:hypothetical protein
MSHMVLAPWRSGFEAFGDRLRGHVAVRGMPAGGSAMEEDDLGGFVLHAEPRGQRLRERPAAEHVHQEHAHVGVGPDELLHFTEGGSR